MRLIKVIDIENGNESQVEAEVSNGIPNTVYRNSSTKLLDEKHKTSLSDKFGPIPLGSCFTEGEFILPLFIQPSSKLGFYFGVAKTAIPQEKQRYLGVCKSEKTIENVNYQGQELIFPIEFK
jgi:hypothetical protein